MATKECVACYSIKFCKMRVIRYLTYQKKLQHILVPLCAQLRKEKKNTSLNSVTRRLQNKSKIKDLAGENMLKEDVIKKIGKKPWKEFLEFMTGQTVGINSDGFADYYDHDVENFLRPKNKRFFD